jgi:hypothetical protein
LLLLGDYLVASPGGLFTHFSWGIIYSLLLGDYLLASPGGLFSHFSWGIIYSLHLGDYFLAIYRNTNEANIDHK